MTVRSEREAVRRPRDFALRVPRRTAQVLVITSFAILIVAVIVGVAAVATANAPRATANPTLVQLQQGAAERDIERAYEQATLQIAKVRALNLAISEQQANQIASKALADMKTLRHNAFVALAAANGLASTDAETYATSAEARFDAAPVSRAPSPTPVLLAPRYYTIVSRMSELSTVVADQATAQLTAPATPAPTTPAPSAAPTATVTPRPSPTR